MFAVVRAVDPDILLVIETYGSFDRFRAALPGYDVAPVVTSKSLEVAESEARTRYYDNITYDLDGNMLDPVPASGTTITKAVVVSQGSINRDIDWTVSVDNTPDWVSVEKTTKTTHFTGTYDGDDRDIEHKAVTINVKANTTGAKRTAVIRFTVADGSSISTTLTQNK